MAHRKHHRRATRRNPSKRPTKASRAANARAQRAEEKALRAGLSMDRAKMYPYPGPRPARTKRASARSRARKASGFSRGAGGVKRRAAVTHNAAALAAEIRTGDRVIVVRGTPPGEKRTHSPKVVYSANVGGVRYNPSKPGKRRKSHGRKHARRNPTPKRSKITGRWLKR